MGTAPAVTCSKMDLAMRNFILARVLFLYRQSLHNKSTCVTECGTSKNRSRCLGDVDDLFTHTSIDGMVDGFTSSLKHFAVSAQ